MIANFPVKKDQIIATGWNMGKCKFFNKPMIKSSGHQIKEILFALNTLTYNQLIPVKPVIYHFGNVNGWILQVNMQLNTGITGCIMASRKKCIIGAPVSGQLNNFYVF